ncbi:MAG: hypothetical protein ACLUIQ_03530 [Dialister invisus]
MTRISRQQYHHQWRCQYFTDGTGIHAGAFDIPSAAVGRSGQKA